MTLRDIIRLMAQHTLARIMERDDFSTRYREGVPIALHEIIYPILQGHDSSMISADVEIGGTDQLFNCLVGRYIQEVRKEVAQTVMCMPLLVGIDGKDKMSKSKGNYIGLSENPNSVYGKIMSIPDALLEDYINLTTSWSESERKKLICQLNAGENPMIVKKAVARNILEQYHGQMVAALAEEFFYKQVQNRDLESKQFQEIYLKTLGLEADNLSLVDLCSAIEQTRSRSEIRRLIQSGSVSVEGVKITDANYKFEKITDGTKLKSGKRGYFIIKT